MGGNNQEALAQHKVPRSDRDRRHGPVHPHPRFLQRRTPSVVHDLELVELADVKVGEEYGLVVTTYAGLYRYRVGDVVRVTGFHNSAPQFHFVCWKNVMLSIDSDKTDEVELQSAVNKATEHLESYGARVIEYTSYTDVSSIPRHYVLFWELNTSEVPAEVLQQCCLTVEESLNSV
ncbi:hypothetical protein SUGI_0381060 [Cryptomeria japonica]|nr:hypothetical protein SUGI_0381060 [Cryptomeria japonica]